MIIAEKGDIDYEGLNDHEKFCLYIFAWNLGETCPFRRTVIKNFEWTEYRTRKIFRECKAQGLVECISLFNEDTGLIAGRGYQFIGKIK